MEKIANELATSNLREHGWLKKEWTSAEISGENGVTPLLHSKTFWGCVKAVQWDRIQTINAARLAAWRAKSEAADRIPV